MEFTKRANILLVEDELIIALATKKTLESYGHEVVSVRNAESALAHATMSNEIDIVLMDVDLGSGIKGPEIARNILARRMVPIVFFTSNTEEGVLREIREITPFHHIKKNINSADLIIAIDRVLRFTRN